VQVTRRSPTRGGFHQGVRDDVARAAPASVAGAHDPRRPLGQRAGHGRRGRRPGQMPARVFAPHRPIPVGVGPLPGDQALMPTQDRRASHRKHHRPAAPRDKPGQGRQPDPVSRLVPGTRNLTAQHSVLVTQDEQLNLLGEVAPREHDHQASQPAHHHVHQGEHHLVMLSTRATVRRRNRSSQP
jgi:hypothetical protein